MGGYTSPDHRLVPSPLSHGGSDEGEEQELDEIDELLQLHTEGDLRHVRPIDLPPLPENASEPMRRVADLYATVAALRAYADRPHALDVMFSARWAAARVRLPRMTVWRAIHALVEAGVLVQGETLPGRGGKRGLHTYRPGVASGGDQQSGDGVVIQAEADRDAPDPNSRVSRKASNQPTSFACSRHQPLPSGGLGATQRGAVGGVGESGGHGENFRHGGGRDSVLEVTACPR